MANRRGRPSTRVIVSPSERATLEQWVRRRSTAQGLALRARIVLACGAIRTSPVAIKGAVIPSGAGASRSQEQMTRHQRLITTPQDACRKVLNGRRAVIACSWSKSAPLAAAGAITVM